MDAWMKDIRIEDLIAGTVVEQYVRCGKPNCRCASRRAEDLHGPYYYHMLRLDGRLHKRYVRKQHVAELKRKCRLRQDFNRRQREQHRETMQTIRDFLRMARAVERLYS